MMWQEPDHKGLLVAKAEAPPVLPLIHQRTEMQSQEAVSDRAQKTVSVSKTKRKALATADVQDDGRRTKRRKVIESKSHPFHIHRSLIECFRRDSQTSGEASRREGASKKAGEGIR